MHLLYLLQEYLFVFITEITENYHYLFDEQPSGLLKYIQNGFIDLGLIHRIDYNFFFVRSEKFIHDKIFPYLLEDLCTFFHVYIGIQVVLVLTFDILQTRTPANHHTSTSLWNLWIMITSSFMQIILVRKRIKDAITYVIPLTKYAMARKYTPISWFIS